MTTAGLELSGSVLRYTEIEQTGPAVRLLRLGNCNFEFDAQADLFSAREQEHLKALGDALADVFENTTATVFRFALPPGHLTSFTALVPAEADSGARGEMIAAEASILGIPVDGDLFPSSGSNGRPSGERLHIARASRLLRERILRICDRIPAPAPADFDESEPSSAQEVSAQDVGRGEGAHSDGEPPRHIELVPSSAAVRHLRIHLDGDSAGPTLLVGCYSGATDYSVVDGETSMLQWTDGMDHPVDRLYFSLDVLDRAGVTVSALSAVRLYGPEAEDELLEVFASGFGDRVRRVNPCAAVNVSPDRFAPGFSFESFAPCIGAALT